MKKDRRVFVSIVWIIIGAVLIGLSFAGKVDAFWNGVGSGLLVVGVIHVLRFYRLNKNEAYREKVETAIKDERNHFLRNKAWAWSGYFFVIIAAVSCIVFRIVNQELLSLAASGAVCLMIVLYWIFYTVLKRKY